MVAKIKAGALGNGEIIERDNGMVCTDVSVELVDYQGMFMDDNGEIHSNDLPEDY